MKRSITLFLLLLAAVLPLEAKEFFVAPTGNDAGKGTAAKPFKTIQKGVNTLKPGDTLTILPGNYFESVHWRFDGDPAKKTTVRAQIPGTVLIHGDKAVTNFKAVPGKKNCYSLPLTASPQGVNECDTYTMYSRDDTMLVSPHPSYGVWTYDEKAKMLYIATSDGLPPKDHTITISQLAGHGFQISPRTKINKVRSVVIDGLCARGFASLRAYAHASMWGFVIMNAENSVIRNSFSYLNEGGIAMYSADKGRIENCQGYGNGTVKHVSAGNIIIFNSKNSTIDNCLSFNSVTYGIRFYGTNSRNTISRAVSIGDSRGSIWIKPDDGTNRIIQCYSPGMVACRTSANCVYRVNDYDRSGKGGPTSLKLNKKHIVTFPNDFADPWNFDLRLPQNSRFKQGFAGPAVYFLAPSGKDTNDGRSVNSPWKTLNKVPAGSTVYLLPGTYTAPLTLTASNVTLAGRGHYGKALIKGGKEGLLIKGNGTVLKRLHFEGQTGSAVTLEGNKLRMENCTFAKLNKAVDVRKKADLQITHNTFAPSVKEVLQGAGVTGFFTHNIAKGKVSGLPAYDNVSSAQNAPAFDGRPYGPYFFLYAPGKIRAEYVTVLANNTSSADIIWYMANESVAPRITIAEKSGRNRKLFSSSNLKASFHSVTVNGLKPDTEYVYNLLLCPTMQYTLSGNGITKKFNPAKLRHAPSKTYTFRTPKADRAPKVWHVSVKGSDNNDGSAKAPFKTISRAAMATAPGDTVLVGAGSYSESVFVPVSGTAAKPITYKAAPNAEVWIDGADRKFFRAFTLFGKSHLNFDGFRFKEFGTAVPNGSGIIFAQGGENITLTRCFSDGRGPGYCPPIIHTRNSRNISMKQNVCIGGMNALVFVETPGVEVVNNIIRKPAIWALVFHTASKNMKILVANNIFTDNIRGKTFQAPLKPSYLTNLVEKNNLYFMRMPRNLRKLVECATPQGKLKQYTYDEFCKAAGTKATAIFADPKIKVISTQLCWQTFAQRAADLKKGMNFARNNNNTEEARNPKNYSQFRHWGFEDFFNQELFRKHGIGLDKNLFKDAAVKAQPGWSQR